MPVLSTKHTCVDGLSPVVQHVPLQLVWLVKQHRLRFCGGPVMVLSVHRCGGVAPSLLQQSRLPQHSWLAPQHDLAFDSPHTLVGKQQS